jgi:hypothetical protein
VISIFEVRVGPCFSASRHADARVRASRSIQSASGARGTGLHRDLRDPMRLLAIASHPERVVVAGDAA